MSSTVVRYSDVELEEFRQLIADKLAKSKEQLASLQEQILDITENTSDEHGGDWVDDSSINNEVEMLNNMAIRQRMYIKDLENALVRIKNKSYGICSITGQLIDKKRLLAVPTTTKSLEAKAVESKPTDTEAPAKPKPQPKPAVAAPTERKVITKVIRKPTNPGAKPAVKDDDEEEDLEFDKDIFYDDDEDDDSMTRSMGDLDDFADDDSGSNDDIDF
ncbi:MAG: TraR/DksA family transcriptional regulator [Saprospiraceae bacterium]|nr:TraR/DksA family transcriptional regulator [Saprospiraceae bacterium]